MKTETRGGSEGGETGGGGRRAVTLSLEVVDRVELSEDLTRLLNDVAVALSTGRLPGTVGGGGGRDLLGDGDGDAADGADRRARVRGDHEEGIARAVGGVGRRVGHLGVGRVVAAGAVRGREGRDGRARARARRRPGRNEARARRGRREEARDRSSRVGGDADLEATALEVLLADEGRGSVVVRVRVLCDDNLGDVLEVLAEALVDEERDLEGGVVLVEGLGGGERVSNRSEGGDGKGKRWSSLGEASS